MIQELHNPFPDSTCFFCGAESTCGLHLRFYRDDLSREVHADYLPEIRFAGQGTILHGGMQAGILDEIMGWTGFAETGALAVTTKLDIEYLAPVYIESRPVRVSCHLVLNGEKEMTLDAQIVDADGTVCTRATGRFHKIRKERYDALVRRN